MFAFLPAEFSILGDVTKDYAWFPVDASTFAADNDWLFGFISWICLLFFIPIAFALFYFGWKYHKPKGGKAESNVAHNTPLELAWSVGPSFFLVGMFVIGAKSFLDHRTVPDGANELSVQAQKWSWQIDYGRGTFHNEMHILVDEPTLLSMRSSDVIHALFVPAFRAKKDIVPGRYNYMWFKPTLANEKVSDEELARATEASKGQMWDYDKYQFTPDGYRFYDLYCAEYCGKDHSTMQTVVVVHKTLEDLNAWIKENGARPDGESPESYGEKLYNRRGCSGCHSVDGSKRVGPSFKDLFGSQHGLVGGQQVTVSENYVQESIVDPKAKIVEGYAPVMPSYKGQLSPDDIYSLIEYLKSLSAQGASSPAAAGAEESSDPPADAPQSVN